MAKKKEGKKDTVKATKKVKEKKKGGGIIKGIIVLLIAIVFIAMIFGDDDKSNKQAKTQTNQNAQDVSSTDDSSDSKETDENNLSEQNISDSVESEEIINIAPEYEDGSIEKDIQNHAANIIKEDYTNTDISEIAINENLGTEEVGDYIILARLTWNAKNSGSMSRKMLEMYSDDFAARIGNDQPSVNEVAIFWTVPYLGDANAKWAYERNGEGMYLSDNMTDTVFSDDSLFR